MKVLFVASGNSQFGITPIVKNQGISLSQSGVELDYYLVKGKGVRNYLKSIPELRKKILVGNYDVIHAHYSLCGFIGYFATSLPLVVSLMGSDVKGSHAFKRVLKFFIRYLWKITIVKSLDMKSALGLNSCKVIPNGVDIKLFHPIEREQCVKKLKWDGTKKNILFAANPDRIEKNYGLALKAVQGLNDDRIKLHVLKDVCNEEMPLFYNAADVVLLTSLYEGSPNVIKEAMACNRPIVATDVGDIAWLLKGVNHGFVCEQNKLDITKCIALSLNDQEWVNSRERLIALELDSRSVAYRLLEIYQEAINE